MVLGALIASNVVIMGVNAAFPNDTYTSGEVRGNGVALRSAGSESAKRLELMYNQENVLIDINTEGDMWLHVKRMKTGTIGYSKSVYIVKW